MNKSIEPLKTPLELEEVTASFSQGQLSLRNEDGLTALQFDDYIPSIRPWMRYSSLTMVIGFLSAIAFMAICPFRVVVRGTGIVRPAGELSIINSPFEGRLKQINVSTNQEIKTGQVVVTLDVTDMKSRLQEIDKNIKQIGIQSLSFLSQSRAEYESALVEVQKNRSQLRLAESEYRRFQNLMKTGAASIQQVEELESGLNVAKANLDKSIKSITEIESRNINIEAQLKRELFAQEASGAKVRRDLSQAQVRSPVRGYVHRLEVRSPGQTISIGQPIASIAPRDSALVIQAIVPGEEIANVKVGQSAYMKISACPHPDFGVLKATVTSIAPDAIAQGQGSKETFEESKGAVQGYEVRLRPEKSYLISPIRKCEIKIGMNLTADIITRNESMLIFLLRKARIITGS